MEYQRGRIRTTPCVPGSAGVSRRRPRSPSGCQGRRACRRGGRRVELRSREEPPRCRRGFRRGGRRSGSCWMVSAPWTPTDFPAAAALACFTALSMPSVTKWTVELGRGHPAGMWWVSTNAGPHAWFPPQPWATSKVRRPVSTAPSSDERPRRCSALGADTLNVMGSAPPVWNSTSPELKYQSNTSATPSLRSAT